MKKTIHYIILFVCIFECLSGSDVFGQKRGCGTEEIEAIRREKYNAPTREEFEKWMEYKLDEKRNKLVPYRVDGVAEEQAYKIAIVVHVIHQEGENIGEGSNISYEQIVSQIEVLNEDFNRQNTDASETQSMFLPVVGKLNIEFMLAKRDPEGNPTTGIIRKVSADGKVSYRNTLEDKESLANQSHWPGEDYLNIWVTNMSGNYLGVGQYPDTDLILGLEKDFDRKNALTDGLVIDYSVFGSIDKVPGANLMSVYDKGRTATHEIGHYLGLRHTWGDGDCNKDDFVDDTPVSDTNYNGLCPSNWTSCGSTDMYENYMYYTADRCMNAFTIGQVERMQIVLDNAVRRKTLSSSPGLLPPDASYYDLGIERIKHPGVVISESNQFGVITVKNKGTETINNFDVIYAIDNQPSETYAYAGQPLLMGQETDVQLPFSGLSSSTHTLSVTLQLPAAITDFNPLNNEREHIFIIDDHTDFIPRRDNFESDYVTSSGWITINYDKQTGWETTEASGALRDNNSVFINSFNYEDIGQEDWLISPSLDFSGTDEAALFFRSSYAINADFVDHLKIYASTDAGETFNILLDDLKGLSLSPKRSTNYWEPATFSDWKSHWIDLSQLAGEEHVRIAFVMVNGYGNNLYLDDIEFYTSAPDNVVITGERSFILYPNPTLNGRFKMAIKTDIRQDIRVMVYDRMGKIHDEVTFADALNQNYEFDLTGKAQGVYFVKVIGDTFVQSRKIVVHQQ